MLPAAVAGSCFVKIGWNLKASPGLLGNRPSDLNAITEIDTLDGHERHNVRSADARVDAAVAIQVDQFTGASNGPQRRFTHRFTTAHKRNDGAIVIDVHLGIQHVRIRAGNEGVKDGLDFGSVLALTEIGNALHNGLHIQNLAQDPTGPHSAIATFEEHCCRARAAGVTPRNTVVTPTGRHGLPGIVLL